MEAALRERLGRKAVDDLRRILLESDWGPALDPSGRKPAPRRSARKK